MGCDGLGGLGRGQYRPTGHILGGQDVGKSALRERERAAHTEDDGGGGELRVIE